MKEKQRLREFLVGDKRQKDWEEFDHIELVRDDISSDATV
jgi:hypothetical protein